MLPLDVAALASVLLAVVRPWTPLRHARLATVASLVLPLTLTAAQLLVHGLRWQVVPLHVAVVLVVLVATADLRGSGARHIPLGIVATLFAVVGGTATWALPVVELPEPTGPYTVGTRSYALVDPDRLERFGERPEQQRELGVQVWYPAASDTNSSAPWLEDADAVLSTIASEYALPSFVLGHLAEVASHAEADAAPSENGPWPVVIFSHGWSGFRTLHSSQMETLASNGYVVVAIDHTHAALVARLDDEVVPLDPAMLPLDVDRDAYEQAASELVETFAADVETVFSQLGDTVESEIDALIDRQRVVAAGHSTGAAGAVVACSRNRWCDAVVGFDPWTEPLPDEVVGAGLSVPLLSIGSEEWTSGDNAVRLRRLHAGSRGPEGRIVISGTLHRDFTLLPLLSPLSSSLGLSGPTPVRDTHAITLEWMVAFLDHHLRGQGPDPLAFEPDDPRVTIARNG